MRQNAMLPKDSTFVAPMKVSSLTWVAVSQYRQHEEVSGSEEVDQRNDQMCGSDAPMKVELRSESPNVCADSFCPAPAAQSELRQKALHYPVEVSLEAALQAAEAQQLPLLPPPGLAESLGLPSRGSVLHTHGACKPCGWFWKPQGCQNGAECGHCHLCPRGENRMRKKAKRSAVHAQMAQQLQQPTSMTGTLSSLNEATTERQPSCSQSSSSSHEEMSSVDRSARWAECSRRAVRQDQFLML